jgi:pantoate--beta-alanine ligase
MKVVSQPAQMREIAERLLSAGTVGLVPTMGALHAGHLSLIAASRARDAATVASIFVNPKQFGPSEDFARYPRQLDTDRELLQQAAVEVVFTPSVSDMYPEGFATRVQVEGLNARLCGRSRPGHFDGVATVVTKLLNIVRPTRAYFGQKDAAQVAVLRRMVLDLNLPGELVVCPIVRESDGLALSSRNAYLSPEERHSALALSRALREVRQRIETGERNASRLREAALRLLDSTKGIRVDYVEIVDSNSLLPVEQVRPNTLVAVAAFFGGTRLIDNLLVDASGRPML